MPEKYVFSDGQASTDVLNKIELVGPTNFSVILYGKSGTGKEAFAHQIHHKSARNKSPFLAIDCGALPKELSGSILFGHEKGAFTGALGEKEGALENASGGTVFLDEITNLPYEIQVSLLRVLQERKIRRVGGTNDIPIDVRIIVASNFQLWEACKQGKFREDLYHRLNEFAIDIKPLAERKDEILFYAHHFLQQSNNELEKAVKGFMPQASDALMEYHWPGNLRELRNLVRRSVLLTTSDQIGLEILPDEMTKKRPSPTRGGSVPTTHDPVQRAENDYRIIVDALQKTSFNMKRAGALLGMDLKTMNSKIKPWPTCMASKWLFNTLSNKDERCSNKTDILPAN